MKPDTRPQPKIDNEVYTPDYATDMIVPYIPKQVKMIWECCIGKGDMARRLSERGYEVFGDIAEDATQVFGQYTGVDAVITNPPFETKLRLSILKSILLLDKPTAFLIRLSHIGGVGMYEIINSIIPERFQFIIPSRRINYIANSSCSFHSIWLTYKFNLKHDILFIE